MEETNAECLLDGIKNNRYTGLEYGYVFLDITTSKRLSRMVEINCCVILLIVRSD